MLLTDSTPAEAGWSRDPGIQHSQSAPPWPRLIGHASAPKVREFLLSLLRYWSRARQMRGLTPRSRRGPTASHQARRAALSIIRTSGLASRRWSRLTSNVRPRREPVHQSPHLLQVVPAVASPASRCGQDSVLLVVGASRRRALPGSQSSEAAASGRGRQSRAPHRICPGQSRLKSRLWHSASAGFNSAASSSHSRSSTLRSGVPAFLTPALVSRLANARPNPSVEARPNGKPPSPLVGVVYHPPVGLGVSPSIPPHLER